MKDITKIRREFDLDQLSTEKAGTNPFHLFSLWFDDAFHAGSPDANAATFITVNKLHQPSGRVVLLKEITEQGFVFFTNYHSRKGLDLEYNPRSAMLFFWPSLQRQVRIEGQTQKVDGDMADDYFSSRPRGSRISAWASPQSSIVSSRQALDDMYDACQKKWEGKEIARPPYWGGYVLRPENIEFWQGRENRLHDRLIFVRHNEDWVVNRLAP